MYIQTLNKVDCCGCTACVSVCPKNCLVMKPDEYGFLFPHMEHADTCIHCKKCESVCPIELNKGIDPDKIYDEPLCFSGWHKNNKTRLESTSGAAFVSIVQACEMNGFGRFYGVKYNDQLLAVHCGVDSVSELSGLISSKYIQSNVDKAYTDILIDLDRGAKVVFSGTPCQVEGLQNVVPKRLRDNLITIALVCHGVSSPSAYLKYLAEIGVKHNSRVSAVKFRDKREKNGILSHEYTTITLANGNTLADTENLYTLAFGLGLMHRDCCNSCPYTTPYRSADFTIGDFWGIEDYKPEFKAEISKGISLLYAHSDRAKALIPSIQNVMFLCEEPLEHSLHVRQPELRKPMPRNPRRDHFLKEVVVLHSSFEKLAGKEFQRWRYINFIKRMAKKFLRRGQA